MKEKEIERVLKALANKRRLAIVKYLHKRERASVGAIAEEIKLSFKSTSHHLLLLSAADLLEREQTNTTVLYRLARPVPSVLKVVLSIL